MQFFGHEFWPVFLAKPINSGGNRPASAASSLAEQAKSGVSRPLIRRESMLRFALLSPD
jgi:hypothetical protein